MRPYERLNDDPRDDQHASVDLLVRKRFQPRHPHVRDESCRESGHGDGRRNQKRVRMKDGPVQDQAACEVQSLGRG